MAMVCIANDNLYHGLLPEDREALDYFCRLIDLLEAKRGPDRLRLLRLMRHEGDVYRWQRQGIHWWHRVTRCH
jgi:hypothetical protein